jgi:hypothetical protein
VRRRLFNLVRRSFTLRAVALLGAMTAVWWLDRVLLSRGSRWIAYGTISILVMSG